MVSRLLSNPNVQLFLARLAVSSFPRVLRLGKSAFVFRWRDVADVLRRDDDFRIAPVNQDRIEGVSGPFFLGMDRSPEYFHQRQNGYAAFAPQMTGAVISDIEQRANNRLSQSILNKGEKPVVDVVSHVIRPVAAHTARQIFGVTAHDEQEYMTTIRAVFHETFLNQGNDPKITERGRTAGAVLSKWTLTEIAKRRKSEEHGSDFLGRLMSQMPKAEDEDIAHIVNGYLVGAIDTTTTTTTQALYQILRQPDLQKSIAEDLDNPRRLLGWVMEVLRSHPHNPVILRETVKATEIAGKPILPGTKVFAVTLSAMQDRSVFLNPSLKDPTRELTNYMHFGYGPHACAGRDLNIIQIPILIKSILNHNPIAVKKYKSSGPFPSQMDVTFAGASHA